MARAGKRSRTIAYDLNKMSQELRYAVLEVGMEVLGELAEKVAEEANSRAPFIEHEDIPDTPYTSQKVGKGRHEMPLRRGPNKTGSSDSGPIKGNVFAQESQKVPLSWLVISPAWYSHFAEYGTSIHEMPRKSKAGKKMVFPGTHEFEGEMVATKKVTHPGCTPRPPFMRPAADMAEKFLSEILKDKGLSNK